MACKKERTASKFYVGGRFQRATTTHTNQNQTIYFEYKRNAYNMETKSSEIFNLRRRIRRNTHVSFKKSHKKRYTSTRTSLLLLCKCQCIVFLSNIDSSTRSNTSHKICIFKFCCRQDLVCLFALSFFLKEKNISFPESNRLVVCVCLFVCFTFFERK